MAEIKGPPRRGKQLEAPPPSAEVKGNIEKKTDTRVDLNFKMQPTFRDEFHKLAAMHSINSHELLRRAFACYKEKYGDLEDAMRRLLDGKR